MDVEQFWGLQVYVVSARGARKIVDTAFPIVMQFDGHLTTLAKLGELVILWRADAPHGLHLGERWFSASTIQIAACDICNLPSSYSRPRDVAFWMLVGAGLAHFGPRAWRGYAARRLVQHVS